MSSPVTRYSGCSGGTAPERFPGFILDGSWYLDGSTGPITLGSTVERYADGVWPDAVPFACDDEQVTRYSCEGA